jgi:hypothetical protein
MIQSQAETRRTTAYRREITLHSQPETEQDLWVLDKLHGKINGTFVEVGAFDGVYHSNTLCLERDFNWNGWLIESDTKYANIAKRIRRAAVVNATVGPYVQVLPYYVGGQWSGLVEYTRPNLVPGHIEHKNPIEKRLTAPLQRIMRDLPAPIVVDYLSIDVEGAEYPVLQSYFSNPPVIFRCITAEIGTYQDNLKELCDLLSPWGYVLDQVKAWEGYWYHKSLCN